MKLNNLLNSIKNNKGSELIESFEIITLRTTGMRFSAEKEVQMKDDLAEVVEYGIRYADGEDKRIVEMKALCDKERILKLLNDCDILSWDGFVGKHPKNVQDGIMFTLNGTVNGRHIYATGSENFPKHYREFENGLSEILKEAQEAYE